MDVKDYILGEFESAKRLTGRVLNGLTHSEISWRPGEGCNSIGLIYFHMIRAEDTFIQTRIQGKPPIWESEKWFQKFNMSATDTGSHYTAEQVECFPVPELKDLESYAEAVRVKTIEYLKNMPAGQFDQIVKLPFGDRSIGAVFALVNGHQFQHIGEMSYLRGLQRGIDK